MKTTILGLLILFVLGLYSCQDVNDSTTTSEEAVLKSAVVAETDITAQSAYDEVTYEAEYFAEAEHLLRKLAHFRHGKGLLDGRHVDHYEGDNPVVSIDTADTGYPIVITIDYGDSTILHNGTVISGTVIIEISADRNTDGATRTISYVDCMVDSVEFSGTSTKVLTISSDSTRSTTSNSQIMFAFGDTLQLDYTGNRTRAWLSGADTEMDHSDDMIEITGMVTIDASTGDTWTKEIVEPLIRLGDCRYYVQGIVQYKLNDEIQSEINYGDGECDNVAIMTVNGEEIEIELRGDKTKADCSRSGEDKDNSGKKNNNGKKH